MDIGVWDMDTVAGMLQVVIAIVTGICGIGIKVILSRLSAVDERLSDFDDKMDLLRTEFHEELKEFQRKELCMSHREYMNKRIDDLYKDFCPINNKTAQ